jgi:monoterpene epsilon-lactone hydrolase
MASPESNALKLELKAVIDQASGNGDSPPSLADMRASSFAFGELASEPDGVTWSDVDAGGIPALWVDPGGGATDRVVQYVHGGGYVLGSTASYRRFTGHIAKSVGCRVLSIDYRLAPENPHPAPIDDSTQAYRWLLEQGYAAERVAIAGDSAGGGLSLATLLALRDAGTPLPAACVPLSPWTDMECTGATMTTNAERDVVIQGRMLLVMAGLFLGGRDSKDPLAAPLHGDFHGIPPIYIQVGGDETLLDDSTRVAERARDAGVDVTLETFPEMQHVFQIGVGRVPESDDAVAKLGGFLQTHLGL